MLPGLIRHYNLSLCAFLQKSNPPDCTKNPIALLQRDDNCTVQKYYLAGSTGLLMAWLHSMLIALFSILI
jgi:hypothetical protein